MNSRFPILTTISILLKVLAVVVLAGGVIAGIVQGGGEMVLIWIRAAISAISLWAYAELIAVVLAIEENTRQTRDGIVAARPRS